MSFPPQQLGQQQPGRDPREDLFSQLFGQGQRSPQQSRPPTGGFLQPEESLFLGDDEQDALALLLGQFLGGSSPQGGSFGGGDPFGGGGGIFQNPNQLSGIMDLFRQNQNRSLSGLGQQQGGLI